MKSQHNILKSIIAIVLLLCLTGMPAQAGWDYQGSDYSTKWSKTTWFGISCMSPSDTSSTGFANPTADPGPFCTASVYTGGSRTMRWNWLGGGLPTYYWAELTVTASCTGTDKPNLGTSIGAPNASGSKTRWIKKNTSGGTLAVSFSANAGGSSSSNSVSASIGNSVVLHQSCSATMPNRKTVPPPGKRGAPRHGGPARFVPKHGGAEEGNDPVDLATGEHLYIPCADISVYNPYGPSVVYQKNFLSKVAKEGHASPGQTVGWVDTYDVKINSSNPQAWSALTLAYPNSAQETLAVLLDGNGYPTGEFSEPVGSEYFVTGVPSQTTGQWDTISITFKDQTTWTLTPTATGAYALTRITDRMGHYVSIGRDSNNGYRVTQIIDDCTPANTLLTFTYTNGYLTSVEDIYGRKVVYTYGTSAGATCLLTISQIGLSSASSLPSRWTFDYTAYPDPGDPQQPDQPHVTSVSFPSPTGSGVSTETYNYNSDSQVESIVDANGNQTVFSYESPDATRIQIKNAQSEVQSEWIEDFDPTHGNIGVGTTQINGYNVALYCEDSQNPTKPTKIVDQKNQTTLFTYDEFGNVLTVTSPRETVTTYTYDYPDDAYPSEFPLGRLLSIQEATKGATTFTYDEPTGLVESVTGPEPGSTGGSSTVTTSFTYDGLGNVLTKVAPGNNAAQTITTTCNYTTDGSYTQSAKIGQPLTITDQLGHVTHIRYDSRGNVTESVDALGNTTNFTYNIANQLSDVIHPEIAQ